MQKSMKNTEVTLAAFADHSKSFDTIDISILIKEMYALNFSKRIMHWSFSNFNRLRTFCAN